MKNNRKGCKNYPQRELMRKIKNTINKDTKITPSNLVIILSFVKKKNRKTEDNIITGQSVL